MGTWGFSEMILRMAPVSNGFICFSVSERVLWVLLYVLCGFPGFYCHLPTVLVPVLPITFSDFTHTMRFAMFRNLEILFALSLM